MSINNCNPPSFGSLYQTATSSLARQKLSTCYNVVGSQKKLITDLDKKGYDVLVGLRDDAAWDTKTPFAITIEVCEKFKKHFTDTFTPLLKLNDKYNAVKTIELDKDINKNILKFLDHVRAAIQEK